MRKFLLLLLIGSLRGYAQDFDWVKDAAINLSLNPDMVNYVVAADGSGNAYMCGFKDGQSSWSIDILGNLYFNKYNVDGELLFSETITGKVAAYAMVSDATGNVYLAVGYNQVISYQTLSIDTGMLGLKSMLLKLDADGNLVWHLELPEMGSSDPTMQALHIDGDGNLLLAFDNYQHSVIRKYSPQGDEISDIVQQNVNVISSVYTDNEGNIYAAGSCASPNATYQGVVMGTSLQYSTYLAKYSPVGEFQWVRYVEDITCPNPQVRANSPDEVYFCSVMWESVLIGDVQTEGPAATFNTDFYLARFNASGDVEWVREVPGSGTATPGSRSPLAVDSQGNVYLGGRTAQQVTWNAGTTTIPSGADALLLRYSPEGVVNYAIVAGGSFQDRCDGVIVNQQGEVYITGLTNGTSSFGSLTLEGSGNRPYLAKLHQGIFSVDDHEVPFAVFPNPVSDHIYFSIDPGNSVEVYNILGARISEIAVDGQVADVSSLASGVYLLKLINGATFRILKN